jgi:hypothetical protein
MVDVSHAVPAPARPLARRLAFAVGVLFLLIGAAGFVPGLTAHFDELRFAGHQSGALLFNTFQVSVLHNLVHLAYGVAGLVMARDADAARTYLIAGGAIYLLLWLYGLVIHEPSGANFVPFNVADNWLHLLLGLGMIGLGLLTSSRSARH